MGELYKGCEERLFELVDFELLLADFLDQIALVSDCLEIIKNIATLTADHLRGFPDLIDEIFQLLEQQVKFHPLFAANDYCIYRELLGKIYKSLYFQ